MRRVSGTFSAFRALDGGPYWLGGAIPPSHAAQASSQADFYCLR